VKSLKVLHIIGGGEFGGAEKHILNLAGVLDQKAVDLTVCCLFSAPFVQIAAKAGINALAVPMHSKFDFAVMGKLSDLIKHGEYDLVHTHGVRANLLGRLAARRAGKKKVITTVHSLLEKDYREIASRYANTLAEKATRFLTDHFIAVSKGLKDRLVAGGIPANSITVIYNGILLDELKPEQATVVARREKFGGRETSLVGIVARLHVVKGHCYFLDAAREVLLQRPQTRFLIVGDGPNRGELEKLADSMGISDRVIFTGFVEDVYSLMAGLDLLVISSLWEGFGLTAIEAMVLGTPVVATEVGGLPEVVQHGETGLLTPPANGPSLAKNIIWMLDHPQEAREMAGKGGDIVRREFTAEEMARRTIDLYRKVLAKDSV